MAEKSKLEGQKAIGVRAKYIDSHGHIKN